MTEEHLWPVWSQALALPPHAADGFLVPEHEGPLPRLRLLPVSADVLLPLPVAPERLVLPSLLVCEQRVHVCGGREAKEQAVRRPGEQRPMKQSREAKTEIQRTKDMKAKQREELLRALKARFEKNMNRHKGLEWAKVQAKLEANTEKLWSLNEMERTGGEPDVVGHDKRTGEYIFYDCSAESPKGRRSVCYDREGQEARKAFKPKDNAIDMAAAIGIEL